MTKLRIGVFVDTSIGSDTEITPNTWCRLEFNSLDRTGCGLETFVGIFGSNSGSDDVRIDIFVPFFHEVDLVSAVHITSEKATDFRNIVQRNSHRNLKLCSRQVDT